MMQSHGEDAYRQVNDALRVARDLHFTGPITFHCRDGIPQAVEMPLKLPFGQPLRDFHRLVARSTSPGR